MTAQKSKPKSPASARRPTAARPASKARGPAAAKLAPAKPAPAKPAAAPASTAPAAPQPQAAPATEPKPKKEAPLPRQLQAPPDGYADIFKRLRTVLRGYATRLRVAQTGPDSYELWSKKSAPKGGNTYFGGVRLGQKFVSFHLFPVYVMPKLLEDVSPALKKRMQGKSCFNFDRADEALFTELAALTQKSFDLFEARGMI